MLGNVIGGFIVILVGLSLAPTVADQVYVTRGNGTAFADYNNISTAGYTIMGLITMFYCLGIASVGIGMASVGLRNAGLM